LEDSFGLKRHANEEERIVAISIHFIPSQIIFYATTFTLFLKPITLPRYQDQYHQFVITCINILSQYSGFEEVTLALR